MCSVYWTCVWPFLKLLCVISSIYAGVSAEVSYKKLGCYRDNWQQERPLNELLFTDRDETSSKYSGRKYTKENFNRRYLDDLVGRCASECKRLGYQVFGIEKFAECYSGDGGLATYSRDGPTRQCFTSKYQPCDTTCQEEPCTGTENTLFVYQLGTPSKTSKSCSTPKKTTAPTSPTRKPTQTSQPKTATPTRKRTSQSTKPFRSAPTKSISTSSVSTRPANTKPVKPTRRRLPSSKGTSPLTIIGQSTRGLSSRPTKLPSTRRTLTSGKGTTSKKTANRKTTLKTMLKTKPTQKPKFTKATRPTVGTSTYWPCICATKPKQPQTAKPTSRQVPSSKGTIPITKVTKATPSTSARSFSPNSVATRPTKTIATKSPTQTIPSSKATKSTTGATARRTPSNSLASRQTSPTVSTQTTSSLLSNKVTTKSPKTPAATQNAVQRPYPTKSCCVKQPPISLVCAPQCRISCTAVCPPACCVTQPLHYSAVYSSPFHQQQPIHTNQCPSPCPSACAPRCSFFCCNTRIYQPPLYLKRKVIGRKKAKTNHGKERKHHNLHKLKKAIKLTQK